MGGWTRLGWRYHIEFKGRMMAIARYDKDDGNTKMVIKKYRGTIISYYGMW